MAEAEVTPLPLLAVLVIALAGCGTADPPATPRPTPTPAPTALPTHTFTALDWAIAKGPPAGHPQPRHRPIPLAEMRRQQMSTFNRAGTTSSRVRTKNIGISTPPLFLPTCLAATPLLFALPPLTRNSTPANQSEK